MFFNLKVYSTNFMPFFFDNLCRLLGQEFLMFTDSPPPPRDAATDNSKEEKKTNRPESKLLKQILFPQFAPCFCAASLWLS